MRLLARNWPHADFRDQYNREEFFDCDMNRFPKPLTKFCANQLIGTADASEAKGT